MTLAPSPGARMSHPPGQDGRPGRRLGAWWPPRSSKPTWPRISVRRVRFPSASATRPSPAGRRTWWVPGPQEAELIVRALSVLVHETWQAGDRRTARPAAGSVDGILSGTVDRTSTRRRPG
jgi:hypothetical protein